MDRKKTTEFLGNLLVSDRFVGNENRLIDTKGENKILGKPQK